MLIFLPQKINTLNTKIQYNFFTFLKLIMPSSVCNLEREQNTDIKNNDITVANL